MNQIFPNRQTGVEKKNHFVFVYLSPEGKAFVGKTCQSPQERLYEESAKSLSSKYKTWKYKETPFRNDLLKFGKDTFTLVEVVICSNPESVQPILEMLYKKYDSTNPEKGYNKK